MGISSRSCAAARAPGKRAVNMRSSRPRRRRYQAARRRQPWSARSRRGPMRASKTAPSDGAASATVRCRILMEVPARGTGRRMDRPSGLRVRPTAARSVLGMRATARSFPSSARLPWTEGRRRHRMRLRLHLSCPRCLTRVRLRRLPTGARGRRPEMRRRRHPMRLPLRPLLLRLGSRAMAVMAAEAAAPRSAASASVHSARSSR